jgi:hypothetical protein
VRYTYGLVAVMVWAMFGATAQAQLHADTEPVSRVVQLLEASGYRYTKETAWLWSVPFAGANMPRVSVWLMTNNEDLIVEAVIARRDQVVRAPEAMRQLLRMNGARDGLTLLIDDEGNYVVRTRLVLDLLETSSFQSSVQAVVAATDEAYDAVKDFLSEETRRIVGVTHGFGPSAGATTRLELSGGKAFLSFNPRTWKEVPSGEVGKRMFEHADGLGFATVIAERIDVPTEQLRDRALADMRKTASEVRVVTEQRRRVNGTDMLSLQTDVTVQGIPLTYLGYYYGGASGTVQVVTYTQRAQFADARREFEEFLDGLRVDP